MFTVNKVWSPSFNIKHSSSDHLIKKRNRILFCKVRRSNPVLYGYSYPNTFTMFPSYWLRKNVRDGSKYYFPCDEDLDVNYIYKQYE